MGAMGHNGGPTMERGQGWRRYAWKRARADLLPKMPIEVVRRRVKRARELGIDYKSYAGIRAATGRDVIALLFSDNALRLAAGARMPSDRAALVDAVKDTDLLALLHPPQQTERFLAAHSAFTAADLAPGISASWSEIRARVLDLKGKLPADGVVVIGETWLERDWCEAARLAGYLPADRYFGT